MLTRGAIGNLINRYRAVLKKCHLINTFGSLAVASMLVMGGAGVAEASVKYFGATTGSGSQSTDGVYYKWEVASAETKLNADTITVSYTQSIPSWLGGGSKTISIDLPVGTISLGTTENATYYRNGANKEFLDNEPTSNSSNITNNPDEINYTDDIIVSGVIVLKNSNSTPTTVEDQPTNIKAITKESELKQKIATFVDDSILTKGLSNTTKTEIKDIIWNSIKDKFLTISCSGIQETKYYYEGYDTTANVASGQTVNGNSLTVKINSDKSGTLNNAGLINIKGVNANTSEYEAGSITVADGGTFNNAASGDVYASGNIYVSGGVFENQGNVNAGQYVEVDANGNKTPTTTTGNITISGGTFDNAGTVTADNNIEISKGSVSNSGTLAAGATVDSNGEVTASGTGGNIEISSKGYNNSTTFNNNGVVTAYKGTIETTDDNGITTSSSNGGNITIKKDLLSTLTVSNTGTMKAEQDFTISGVEFTNDNKVEAGNDFTFDAAFTNNAGATVQAGNNLNANADFTNNANATVAVGGTLTVGNLIGTKVTFTNEGTVRGLAEGEKANISVQQNSAFINKGTANVGTLTLAGFDFITSKAGSFTSSKDIDIDTLKAIGGRLTTTSETIATIGKADNAFLYDLDLVDGATLNVNNGSLTTLNNTMGSGNLNIDNAAVTLANINLSSLLTSGKDIKDVGTDLINDPSKLFELAESSTLDGTQLTAQNGATATVLGGLNVINSGDITITKAKADGTEGSASTLLVVGNANLTGTDADKATLTVTGSNATIAGALTGTNAAISVTDGSQFLADATTLTDSSLTMEGSTGLLGGTTALKELITALTEDGVLTPNGNGTQIGDYSFDFSKLSDEAIALVVNTLSYSNITTKLDKSELQLVDSILGAIGQFIAEKGSSITLQDGSAFVIGGNSSLNDTKVSISGGSALAMGGGLNVTKGEAINVEGSALVVGDILDATERNASFDKSLLYVGDAAKLNKSDLELSSSVAVFGGDMVTDALAGSLATVLQGVAGNIGNSQNTADTLKGYADKALGKVKDLDLAEIQNYINSKTDNEDLTVTLTDSDLTLKKTANETLGSAAVVFGDLKATGSENGTGSNISVTDSGLLVLRHTSLDEKSGLTATNSLIGMGGSLTAKAGSDLSVKGSALVVGDNLDLTGRTTTIENSALYVGDATKLDGSDLTLTGSVAVLGGDVVAKPVVGVAMEALQGTTLTVDKLQSLTPERVFNKVVNIVEGKLKDKTPAQIAAIVNDKMIDTTLDESDLKLTAGSTVAAFGNLDAKASDITVEGSNLFVLGGTTVDASSSLSATGKSLVAMGGSLNVDENATALTVTESALAVGDILDVTGREVNVTKSALYVGDQTKLNNKAHLTLDSSVAVLGGDVLTDALAGAAWQAVQGSAPIEVQFSKAYVESLIESLVKKLDAKLDKVDKLFIKNYLVDHMRDTTLNNSALNVMNGSTAAVFGNLVNNGNSPVTVDDSNLFVLGNSAFTKDSGLTATGSIVGIGRALTVEEAGQVSATAGSTLFVGSDTSLKTGAKLTAEGSTVVLGGGDALVELADVIYDAMKPLVDDLKAGEELDLAALKAAVVANLPGVDMLKKVTTSGGTTNLTGATADVDGSLMAVLGTLESDKSKIELGTSGLFVGDALNSKGGSSLEATDSDLFVGKNTHLTDSSLTAKGSVAMLGGGNLVETLASLVDRDAEGNITVDTQALTYEAIYEALKNSAPTELYGSSLTVEDSDAHNSVAIVAGALNAEKSGNKISAITVDTSSLLVGGSTTLKDGSTLTATDVSNVPGVVAIVGGLTATNGSSVSAAGSSLYVGGNTKLTNSSLATDTSMAVLGGNGILKEIAKVIYNVAKDSAGDLQALLDDPNQLMALVQEHLAIMDFKEAATERKVELIDSKFSAVDKSAVTVLGDLTAKKTASSFSHRATPDITLDNSALLVAGAFEAENETVSAAKSALFVGKNTKLDNATLTADGSVVVLGGGSIVEELIEGAAAVATNGIASVVEVLKTQFNALTSKPNAIGAGTTLTNSTLSAENGSFVGVAGKLAMADSTVNNNVSTMVLMNGLSGDADSSVTNTGTFTVENGTVSGFTGTFNQNTGETIINQGWKDLHDPDGLGNGTDSFFGGTVNLTGGRLVADADKVLNATWANRDFLKKAADGSLVKEAHSNVLTLNSGNNNVASNLHTGANAELWLDLEGKYYTANEYLRVQNELNADNETDGGNGIGSELVFFNGNLLLNDGDRILAGGEVAGTTLTVKNYDVANTHENMTVIAGAGVSVKDAYEGEVTSAPSILGTVTDTTTDHNKFAATLDQMLVIVDQNDVDQKAFTGNIVFDGDKTEGQKHDVKAQGLVIGNGSTIALTDGANLTLAGTHGTNIFIDDADRQNTTNQDVAPGKVVADVTIDGTSSLTIGLGTASTKDQKAELGKVTVNGTHTVAASMGNTTVSYGDVTVAGAHNVFGNDKDTTTVSYKSLTVSGTTGLANATVSVAGNLTNTGTVDTKNSEIKARECRQ